MLEACQVSVFTLVLSREREQGSRLGVTKDNVLYLSKETGDTGTSSTLMISPGRSLEFVSEYTAYVARCNARVAPLWKIVSFLGYRNS